VDAAKRYHQLLNSIYLLENSQALKKERALLVEFPGVLHRPHGQLHSWIDTGSTVPAALRPAGGTKPSSISPWPMTHCSGHMAVEINARQLFHSPMIAASVDDR